MPATGLFDKGRAVEEWSDTIFFRPLGLGIARLCQPTAISPDQITFVALMLGLAAGRLLFYQSIALNAAGVALFVLSDIFDSADGQLARMRGTSTRFGKILDGVSDGARFANLYVQLMARLIVAGSPWWLVIPVGVLAGLAHARQSAAVDYIRQLFMLLAEGGRGEFNLPEDMPIMPASTRFRVIGVRIYHGYLRSAARMVPRSLALVRDLRQGGDDRDVAEAWDRLQRPVVRQCAWIGQNIRFALLAVTVVPQHPMAFLVVTLVPLSLILVAILMVHEGNAQLILDRDMPPVAQAA